MIVWPGLRRSVSAISRLFNSASFVAPLTHTAVPTRAATSTTATFTRATTKTWSNNDGYLVTGLAGEIDFPGARRHRNILPATEDFSGWSVSSSNKPAYNTAPMPDGVANGVLQTSSAPGSVSHQLYRIGQTVTAGPHMAQAYFKKYDTLPCNYVMLNAYDGTGHYVWFDVTGSTPVVATEDAGSSGYVVDAGDGWFVLVHVRTLAASANGGLSLEMSATDGAAGTVIPVGTGAIWAGPGLYDITAEADQSTPRPYVSVGVKSAPYYHGSMVDGVKCFATDINGAAIPSTTLLGYLAEGARTNHFLQSGTPATQTSGSLSTGTYTLWMDGTGSIAVAGATATITGAGTATSASAVTFTVTVAGTVTYTVTGSPTRAQSENGAFRSSYIPTTTIAVARNADVLTYPSSGNISGTVGACYAEAKYSSGAVAGGDIAFLGSIPAGGIPMLLRSGTAALVGYDGAYRTPTGLTAPSAGVVNKMGTTWGGTSFNAANNGAIGVAAGFDGDMNFPATLQVGTYDSVSHPYGTIRNVHIWQRALSSSELKAITS